MAENESLDNFFAKKDKIKKKSTKTRITPDEIGQMLEKKLQKANRKSKDKENMNEESSKNNQVEDDEWTIVEEEKDVDICDLKIQNLGLISKADNELTDAAGQSDNGGSTNEKDSPQGPWKPVSKAVPQEVEAPPQPPQEVPEVKAEVKPQKYIPPAIRNQGLGGSDSKYGMKARKKRTLDVSSVDDFPELGK